MKSLSLVVLLLVLVGGLYGQENRNEGRATQRVQPGGLIRIDLSSGGYTISGRDSDAIVITFEQPQRVKVEIKATDSGADVSIRNTPHSNFRAQIEVPRRSNLWVRLSAGELKIEDVVGNKDIESLAGNIEIEVAHPEEYGHREGSVTAGELDAPAFGVSKAGLWRSFQQEGPGKYRLHAHVGSGNLTLRPAN